MSEPLDLEPFKRRIEELRVEGAEHVKSWADWGVQDHQDGPAVDCPACDDIFGECCALKDLVAEVERLRSSVPLSAIQALVQQWREEVKAMEACGDFDCAGAHRRDADALAALCPAPPEDRK